MYSDDGSIVTSAFVTEAEYIHVSFSGPGSYGYEARSVIQVACEGGTQAIESSIGITGTVSYTAVEEQCVVRAGVCFVNVKINGNTQVQKLIIE